MKLSSLAAGVALSALMVTGAVAADVYTGDKSLKDDSNYASGGTVNWTGFYIGGSLGYGNANHNLSVQQYNGAYCWDQFGDQLTYGADPDGIGPQLPPVTGNTTVAPEDATGPSWFGDGGKPFALAKDGTCANDGLNDFKKSLGGIGADDSIAIDPSSREVGSLDGINSHGLVGDGRIGYDFAHGRFLVGVFGSYGFSNMESNVNGSLGISGNGKDLAIDRIEKGDEWSIGARAGLIVAPRTLLYILAAYTQTDYEFSGVDFDAAAPAKFAKETTFDGVTVGGGVEFALTHNIFLGIEGTHTFYGEETVLDTGGTEVGGFGQRLVDDLDETKVMGTLKIKLNDNLFGK